MEYLSFFIVNPKVIVFFFPIHDTLFFLFRDDFSYMSSFCDRCLFWRLRFPVLGSSPLGRTSVLCTVAFLIESVTCSNFFDPSSHNFLRC